MVGTAYFSLHSPTHHSQFVSLRPLLNTFDLDPRNDIIIIIGGRESVMEQHPLSSRGQRISVALSLTLLPRWPITPLLTQDRHTAANTGLC